MAEKTWGVRWDLGSFFPAFDGPEMKAFKKKLDSDIRALGVRASKLGPLGPKTAPAWEKVLLAAEGCEARLMHLGFYLSCLEAAHSDKEEYSIEKGRFSALEAEFQKTDAEVLRGLKGASERDFKAFLQREALASAAYAVRRARERARHTMSAEEERLAADLGVDGLQAWSRLYDKVSGKLSFEMEVPGGKTVRKPISEWRALMGSADRRVGRAAFEGGNRAWASVEDVCAAALNAIAGTRLTLYKRRGMRHFLDKPLHQAGMSLRTLEAMYEAVRSEIELPREVFRAKGAALGRPGVAWFEREAPLPLKWKSRLTWREGEDMVGRAFEAAYPGLAEYYRDALRKRWIESEACGGKRPGAFCDSSPVNGEQRVFMTFNGALRDVSTIAHEVGHAWHGHLLKEMRPFAQKYPATLAETASVFSEGILAEGLARDEGLPPDARLQLLDADLCSAAVFLLDITVRFEFEKAFHEERARGEVPVSRLKELMASKQREVWGSALEPGGEDPLFWASKLHFYVADVCFYNFPYTVGFLLSRALLAMFREQGPSFLPKYEEFLRLTGSGTLEEVVRRGLGADAGRPAFWAASIRSLREPLASYRKLLKEVSVPT